MYKFKTSTNRFCLALLAIVMCAGCATFTAGIRKANDLSAAGEYDQAIRCLEQEAVKHPKRAEIRTLLYRAKLNSYYFHLAKARERIAAGDKAVARKEYQSALSLFPGNAHLQEEMAANLAEKKKTEQKDKIYIEPPIQLQVKADTKIELALYNTPITNIFKALGKNYNVNFIFDREFRDFIHSVEIKNKNFYDILRMLCLIANSQYRVVDPSTVLVYPDQPYKRQLFDFKAIKTFYLSHIKAEDAKKILQPLFAATGQGLQVQEDPNLNALIVKGDIGTLSEIERFIPNIDIPKSEVEINVEIIEINRSLIRKLGAEFGTTFLTAQMASSTPDPTKTTPPINVDEIDSASFYLTIPSVALNLLETDDNNKLIARPNLRGLDGEKISYMVGDEIPLPQIQLGAYAAGGINTVPTTTYQYKNVGVEIKLTPSIHQNDEVTLETELTINFISGSGYDNFPILGKREIKSKFRLKENETNIIGGFIRDDVRRSLNGLPGLARIPVLGRLFGSTEDTIRQTDLIFSVTPRIIRRIHIREKNLQPIWLNVDENTSGGGVGTVELPPAAGRERPEDPPVPQSGQRNALLISPPQIRIPVNTETIFSVSLQAESPLNTLAVRGTLQGSGEIVEIKNDFFDPSVKTMKYASGASFDAGYTCTDAAKALQNNMILQVKLKCTARGTCTLTVEGTAAADFRQRGLPLSPAAARIEVY